MSARRSPDSGREWRRIEWIRASEAGSTPRGLCLGIGDDAAVWLPGRGKGVVLTVDAQVDGVHFRRSWLTPREIGMRAVEAGVSDLAAMAARPACILASIVSDDDLNDAQFREVHLGIRKAARRSGAVVVGGNISSGPFSLTIVAVGEAAPGRLVRRSGARPGDSIWVTGSPGLARLGLGILARGTPRRGRRAAPAVSRALLAYRRPLARVSEALAISRIVRPSAMIDLSDGLSTDLGHIVDESGREAGSPIGAVLDPEALESLPGLRAAARAIDTSPLEACLCGGDDYELAFTCPEARSGPRRLAALRRSIRVPLTRIGVIGARRGLWLRMRDGSLRSVERTGWEHGRREG